jgi:hypothetical protein
MPSFSHRWLHLSSRIAVLLGLGALSISGAKASTGNDAVPVPQQSARTLDDVLIWHENGRILVSEAGRPAEELHLGRTAEADLLKNLLVREGATAAKPHVLRDRIILVGSGGSGVHWDSQPADEPKKTHGPAMRGINKPAPASVKTGDQPGAERASDNIDANSK